MPVNTTIKIRKGTSSEWNASNPVLASGEPGFVIDTNRFKIGDGSTVWNSLDYGAIVPSGFLAGSGLNINLGSQGVSATISVSGLNTSYLNDFNSAVSGLIPVKDIVAGTGIGVSSSSGIFTIISTGSGVLSEQSASLVTTVFNKTASTIPKMSAVYINGGQGDTPTIQLAIATGDVTSAGTYGLTREAISSMSTGKVTVFGSLSGLNTDQFNPTAPVGNVNGTVLYLSPTTSGALTTTKPHAPNHIVALGTIVRTHQNEGIIEVRVQNGFELEELHNVSTTGVTNGQFLQYNSSSGLWVPSSSGNFTTLQLNGTTVSVSGHTHTSSDITNFDSSVSGLLPTISNSGDNRILTSTGSTVGITAESNLTFDGNLLNVTGSGAFSNNLTLNNQTANTVAGFDASKNIISLSTATYPSLTELSYVKGVTSAIQTQLNGKAATSHTHTSSDIADFNSSVSGLLPVKNIVAGSGVSVSSVSGDYTISATGTSGGGATISNYADNRILTSDGTSTGINGESNLTFDGSTVVVSGSIRLGDTAGNRVQFFKGGGAIYDYSIAKEGNHLAVSTANDGSTFRYTQFGYHSGSTWTPKTVVNNYNGKVGILNTTPSYELDVAGTTYVSGSGIFASGINIGTASTTGVITGLSTTATIPAIRFQSITANHTNTSHVIFDWYKNLSTRIMYIDGAGNIYADSSNANYIAANTSPSSSNGSFIGHGMRRHSTGNGMDFAWGESITSATEPGIDLFPIGGTHIASGILFRLSKNSTKTDVAMLVNGSGNVGIGTTTPTARLQVAGQGVFNSGIVTTTGNFTTSLTSALLNIDNLRLDSNTISSTNSNGDILLTPNGTGKVGIGTSSPSYTLDVNGGAQFNQIYPVVASGSIVSSAVDTDVTTGQIFNIELTENITLNNPTNSVDGVTIRWRIQQDSTGGRTVTLDTKFQIPSSASNPLPWSTGPYVMDTLAATYHAGRDKWDIVAFVPGY